MKNEILFLSVLVPKEMQAEVYEKNIGTAQDAGTALQEKIIKGLEADTGNRVTICNLLPVSSYPRYYKDAVVKRVSFSHASNVDDVNIGFLNVAYIKRFLISVSYKYELKKLLKKKKFGTAICYSTNVALLYGLKYIKKKYPEIRTCLVIPDMPEFNDLSDNKSKMYRWYMNWSAKKFRTMFKYIDSFVFMTEQSAKYLNTGKPYVVVEGIADVSPDINRNSITLDKKIILYTGTTNKQFGVPNLVEAFMGIAGSDYELVICGCGDFDDELRSLAETDTRIKFLGTVPHNQVIDLQQKATILVNPRQNIGEYTKYSFPSKTIEYLSSGVPVVTYKLDGIPNEYDKFIKYVPDNSIKSLRKVLVDVCKKSEKDRVCLGRYAFEFVRDNKNPKVQARKIIELISNKSEF